MRSTRAAGEAHDRFHGGNSRFPGGKWDGSREKTWIFNQIDPRWCQRAANGEIDAVAANLEPGIERVRLDASALVNLDSAGLGALAERLNDSCFADTVFFCNSGTEAV